MSTAATSFPRHALGWPAGSVRAILALGILGYMWLLALLREKDGGWLLSEERVGFAFIYLNVLMLLMIAHFYVAHGKSIGSSVSQRSPLGMPRGSLRFILLAGYIGLGYYMYVNQPTFQIPETGPIFLMLAILLTAFLFGHAITHIVVLFSRGRLPAWFQDIQAWFSLMGLVILGIIVIFRLVINTSLPLEKQINLDVMESILVGVVGFYFGARS